MGEQHLDLLPFAPRDVVGVGSGDVAGDVPGAFMDGTRHLPSRPVGAAVGLQRAGVAIDLGSAIAIGVVRRGIRMIGAEGSALLLQILAARAAIQVGGGTIGEVGAGEGAVGPAILVDDRDVGCDPLVVDQSFQHLGRAIGGVGGGVDLGSLGDLSVYLSNSGFQLGQIGCAVLRHLFGRIASDRDPISLDLVGQLRL